MDEIFEREIKGIGELNGIHNGPMLSRCAEKRIEEGDVVLVPDVTDDTGAEEICMWSNTDPNPKEYKIRIIHLAGFRFVFFDSVMF